MFPAHSWGPSKRQTSRLGALSLLNLGKQTTLKQASITYLFAYSTANRYMPGPLDELEV